MTDVEAQSEIVIKPTPVRSQCLEIVKRIPYQTIGFVILYLGMYYTSPFDSDNYALLAFDSDRPREAYRWWTYSLLHLNNMHIYMNLVMFIIFGSLLEISNMTLRTFAIYNLSILGGAFGCGWSLRFIPRDIPIRLVGASGGIYGLLASQTGYLIINWPELNPILRIFSTSLLIAPTASDIVLSAMNPSEQTSYSTHVGGFVTGVMASICLVKNIRTYRWENILKITTGCILGCYMVAGAVNLATLPI